MKNTLFAVLALANDKGAALSAAASDVATAATRVILHGDAALFQSTAAALEARKGATAKAILGRLLAAQSAAVASRMVGRKGRATAEEVTTAEGLAGEIAEAFRQACLADAESRSNKAKEAQANAKARKMTATASTTAEAEAPATAEAEAPATAEAEAPATAEAEALKAENARLEAENARLQALIAQISEAGSIKAVRALLAA